MADKSRQPNARLLHEARKEVARRPDAPLMDGHADPVAVLQEILDARVADLRYAQQQVDSLREDELFRDTAANGRIPHEWVRLRDDWHEDLERMCHGMVRNGIAGRVAALSEARTLLMVRTVQEAAADAGLSHDQVRALGAALRRRARGTVVEPDLADPALLLAEGEPTDDA